MIELFYDLRWQDLVDITLLTLICYRMILMVQGSRTVQIATGFLIVGVGFYISGLFRLAGLNWVLNNLFSSIIVVIVVLFQKDFRNALAQVGNRSFFRNIESSGALGLLERIFGVCEHLSRTRTGALIILERKMGLGEFYTSAVQLDALFSEQLMVAIFNPHAPLHDGAVIISPGFTITHAGCILPLTSKIDFSKDLGTRHRAALGLSEESDAVILVVSEETGTISLAYMGKLYRAPFVDIRVKLLELFTKTDRQLKREKQGPESEVEN